MKLSDCEMRPGKVLAVCNNYGTIKASCCGLFSEEDDINLLPPVYPWFKFSNTAFCEPQIGDLIWIIYNTTNPLELFYVFQADAVENNSGILDYGHDACCILHKDNEYNAALQWNNSEGWKANQDDSKIQIGPNGDILLSQSDGDHRIDINESGIHLCTDAINQNPAVLGNELKSALQTLVQGMQSVATACKAKSETMAVGVAIDAAMVAFNAKLSTILSKNVTLD